MLAASLVAAFPLPVRASSPPDVTAPTLITSQQGRETHGPVGRRVHHHALSSALAGLGPTLVESSTRSSTAAPLGGTWSALGPQPIVDSIDPVSSGRVTALAVDPNNSATVYAGAAGGGVWKSTDSGNHWASLTDGQLVLAIGALAIDPSNSMVIYAGTGEANHCTDCQPGQGILKSSDGGSTWVLLGQSIFAGRSIAGIVVDRANGNDVLVATRIGLYQSSDGGITWTKSTQLTGGVQSIVQDPTTPGKFWAVVADWCMSETGSIAVSTDGASSWTLTPFPTLPSLSRIALGVGANGVAYAGLAACATTGEPIFAMGQLAAVAKTADGGMTWSTIAPGGATGLIDYFKEPDSAQYQGWYDDAVAVDPTNPNHAVFGGITVLATRDGGSTFVDVARPYSGGPTWADFHAFVFTGADSLYAANDGGVYRTADLGGSGTAADWTNLSGTLAITQFYAGASPDLSHVAGGTQDTGTPAIWPGGATLPAWRSEMGGDGGWVGLIPGSSLMYAETSRLSIYQVDTSTGKSTLAAPCATTTDSACSDPVGFIAPFVVDPTNAARLYAATNRIYRSNGGGVPAGSGGWSVISGDLTTGIGVEPAGDWINTMAIGGGTTAEVVLTGSEGGKVFMTNDAATATPTWIDITGNLPAYATSRDTGHAWITGLAVNPSNASEAWATLGLLGAGRVWHTLSAGDPAGTVWTDITGLAGTGLVDTVVDSVLVDATSPSTLYIGTDGGVMVCTTCGGASAVAGWAPLGIRMPSVRVDGLSQTGDAATIIAWTHGRGAWSIPRPTIAPTPTPTPSPTPTPTPSSTPSPVPAEHVQTGWSTQQYLLASDGVTWTSIDDSKLSLTVTPAEDAIVRLDANADLWTTTTGINQDLGIWVSGADPNLYPGGIVAWKESGGSAAYSPNAAFVHGFISVKAATTYTVILKWKSNQPGGRIYAGAGPLNGTYSPTRLVGEVIPLTGSQVFSGVGTRQYQLSNSDGTSWNDMDGSNLTLSLKPSGDSIAVITGNADLWTATPGYNQDLGIAVSGADPAVYPAGIVAWKESGGAAGYSPNAAAVQALYPMKAGTSYIVKLTWKANRAALGATIYAGAGVGAPYSPTRLSVRMLPSASQARSTQQYALTGSNGASWTHLDAGHLSLQLTPTVSCPALVIVNADLWTETAGVNQDLAISVNGVMVAWKESGGSSGTFWPNAALVETVIELARGTTDTVTLQWKTNVPSAGTIHAGAGPSGGAYSPTVLTVQPTC